MRPILDDCRCCLLVFLDIYIELCMAYWGLRELRNETYVFYRVYCVCLVLSMYIAILLNADQIFHSEKENTASL